VDIVNLKIFADRAAASVEKIGLLIRGVPCTINAQVLNRIGEAFDGDLSAYDWRFAIKENYNSNAPCLRADSVTVDDDTLTAVISTMSTTQLLAAFTEIDQIKTLIGEFTGVIGENDNFVIQFEINVKNRVDADDLPPEPIDEYAKITYVDGQDAENLQDAKNYTDEKVGQFQNLFFYMTESTSATDGTVSFNVKPSGAGTIVNAWGGDITTVSRQVFGFQYTTQNPFTLTPNSPFTVVVPYRNLATNRSYYARYVVTATHSTLNGGNPITLFDLTRGPTTSNNATYDVEFNIVNNQTTELVLPVGTVLEYKIYAYVSTATGTMSILVNDSANTMLVARSERVGQTYAVSIITHPRGYDESQENFNEYMYAAIGQTIIDNALLEGRLNGNS